jgi:phytoene dehydrogenase-like protein
VHAFFDHQRRLADALWRLFDDPEMLPPFSASSVLRHTRRLPEYLPLARWLGRPLDALVRHHGLRDFAPLRHYLDAVCQITVQTSSREAELAFAVGAMDYYFRGTGHLRGGIGTLARAMTRAIEELGGEVRFADRVEGLERRDGQWRARTRTADVRSRQVVANLLPQTVNRLLSGSTTSTARLDRLAGRVEGGWGAAMLYLVLDADAAPAPAHHLQLVADEERPFLRGNHVFCSIGARDEPGRAPAGQRTATVSTHVPMAELLHRDRDGRAAFIAETQETMRRTLTLRAPELAAGIVHEWPASPRTFERFTGRDRGFVGGIPRRVGLHNYGDLGPRSVEDGLWLVGDSVFPGQSVLSVSLGGVRLAERLVREL